MDVDSGCRLLSRAVHSVVLSCARYSVPQNAGRGHCRASRRPGPMPPARKRMFCLCGQVPVIRGYHVVSLSHLNGSCGSCRRFEISSGTHTIPPERRWMPRRPVLFRWSVWGVRAGSVDRVRSRKPGRRIDPDRTQRRTDGLRIPPTPHARGGSAVIGGWYSSPVRCPISGGE